MVCLSVLEKQILELMMYLSFFRLISGLNHISAISCNIHIQNWYSTIEHMVRMHSTGDEGASRHRVHSSQTEFSIMHCILQEAKKQTQPTGNPDGFSTAKTKAVLRPEICHFFRNMEYRKHYFRTSSRIVGAPCFIQSFRNTSYQNAIGSHLCQIASSRHWIFRSWKAL